MGQRDHLYVGIELWELNTSHVVLSRLSKLALFCMFVMKTPDSN